MVTTAATLASPTHICHPRARCLGFRGHGRNGGGVGGGGRGGRRRGGVVHFVSFLLQGQALVVLLLLIVCTVVDLSSYYYFWKGTSIVIGVEAQDHLLKLRPVDDFEDDDDDDDDDFEDDDFEDDDDDETDEYYYDDDDEDYRYRNKDVHKLTTTTRIVKDDSVPPEEEQEQRAQEQQHQVPEERGDPEQQQPREQQQQVSEGNQEQEPQQAQRKQQLSNEQQGEGEEHGNMEEPDIDDVHLEHNDNHHHNHPPPEPLQEEEENRDEGNSVDDQTNEDRSTSTSTQPQQEAQQQQEQHYHKEEEEENVHATHADEYDDNNDRVSNNIIDEDDVKQRESHDNKETAATHETTESGEDEVPALGIEQLLEIMQEEDEEHMTTKPVKEGKRPMEEDEEDWSSGGGDDAWSNEQRQERRKQQQKLALPWPIYQDDLVMEGLSMKEEDRYLEFMDGCDRSVVAATPTMAPMLVGTAAASKKKTTKTTRICWAREQERLAMNRQQPPQMTNFTEAGYAKVIIPSSTQALLHSVWKDHLRHRKASFKQQHKQQQQQQENGGAQQPSVFATLDGSFRREQWDVGSIYTNSWSSPTDVLDIHRVLTQAQVRKVEWDVKQVLEQWSGVALVPTSTYGIRIYNRGSILAPHVDRLPLVLSAILHIAQPPRKKQQQHKRRRRPSEQEEEEDEDNEEDNDDEHDHRHHQEEEGGGGEPAEDEDWPLYVIGHNGVAVNLTLQPGEMILYESHSVIHGRPYPLQSEYYANMFVHFEPIGYTYDLQQRQKQQQGQELTKSSQSSSLQELFQQLLHFHQGNDVDVHNNDQKKKDGPHTMSRKHSQSEEDSSSSSLDIRLPPYLQNHNNDPQSQADLERRWKQDYEFVREKPPRSIKVRDEEDEKTPYVLLLCFVLVVSC